MRPLTGSDIPCHCIRMATIHSWTGNNRKFPIDSCRIYSDLYAINVKVKNKFFFTYFLLLHLLQKVARNATGIYWKFPEISCSGMCRRHAYTVARNVRSCRAWVGPVMTASDRSCQSLPPYTHGGDIFLFRNWQENYRNIPVVVCTTLCTFLKIKNKVNFYFYKMCTMSYKRRQEYSCNFL